MNARSLGNIKMIGRELLYGIVAGFGQIDRRVYLPRGKWINYYSHEWVSSVGDETPDWPIYIKRDGIEGLFTLPLFAAEGSIIPKMVVDSKTLNISGKRSDQSKTDDLVLRVYSSPNQTAFTLYEDDGETLGYLKNQLRTTLVTQVKQGQMAKIDIGAGSGSFAGAMDSRAIRIEFVAENQNVKAVRFDSQNLQPCSAPLFLENAANGCWDKSAGGIVIAKSGLAQISAPHHFQFDLEPAPLTTSVYFVCQNGKTLPGQGIFVTGNIPELGGWDLKKAVPMIAARYPVWSEVISGLPSSTNIQWKCIRKPDNSASSLNQLTTPSTGYFGASRASF